MPDKALKGLPDFAADPHWREVGGGGIWLWDPTAAHVDVLGPFFEFLHRLQAIDRRENPGESPERDPATIIFSESLGRWMLCVGPLEPWLTQTMRVTGRTVEGAVHNANARLLSESLVYSQFVTRERHAQREAERLALIPMGKYTPAERRALVAQLAAHRRVNPDDWLDRPEWKDEPAG